MLFGVFLILLGILLFLRNTGLIAFSGSFWSLFYPLFILIVGIYIILGALKGRRYKNMFMKKYFKEDWKEEE